MGIRGLDILKDKENEPLCSNPECPEAGHCRGECVKNF